MTDMQTHLNQITSGEMPTVQTSESSTSETKMPVLAIAGILAFSLIGTTVLALTLGGDADEGALEEEEESAFDDEDAEEKKRQIMREMGRKGGQKSKRGKSKVSADEKSDGDGV